MRLTKAAFSLIFTAFLCLALGYIFGRIELYLFAGVCATSLVFAALYAVVAPLDLIIRRDFTPTLLRVGNKVQIGLHLFNKNWLRTPVLHALDRLEGHSGAAVYIAPILSRDSAQINYEIPADTRGHLVFGPFDLTITDPFGLIKTTVRAAEATTALIRPELVDLAIMPTAGGDLVGDFSSTQKLSPSGDEFVRLRPYVVGDELRRVHWRASARTGDLVVRQNEEPRTGVMCVLFDIDESRYSYHGFERAVTATLSAVSSGVASNDQLYYATSSSAPQKVTSNADLNTVDLQLALIQPSRSGSTATALAQLTNNSRTGGTLIYITGRNDIQVERIVGAARNSFARIVPVLCETPTPNPPFSHIRYDGTTDLALGWEAASAGSKR